MIDFTFNIETGVARLVQSTVIKPGGDVPVRVTLSAAPDTISGLQLALGSDAAAPEVLAFTEDFTEESETVYVAVLDANDSRLIDHMTGQATAIVNAEFAAVIDGETMIAPHMAVAVQQRIIAGPEATEGGPAYYTEAEVDALLAPLSPAAEQADIAVSAAASTTLFSATLFGSLWRKIAAAAGAGAYSAVYALPVASQTRGAIVEVNIELAASANPTVELRNATTGGTLLATITNPAPGAAAYWFGRFRFNGTAWECLFRAFNS